MFQGLQCLLDQMFRLHIQSGSRVIQNQDRIFLGKRPGNADTLLLSSRESYTPLADDGIILPGHPFDKFTGLGIGGSFPHRIKIQV